ncbi:MAG: sugar phosphate isomerase/epimerase family protein [Fusicatenibacter sp.]|nr:sugar phosphate isomerase/epimerase [Lachnospiraceae bacterium]MDY2937903.1 sugar phosphate isomerase/epimerase family protein [Fusicatenibacter sp.]
MEYGLQLFSVRDFTEKDLAYTLEQVAKIGYKYVEFAGFFGHEAKEVKAMLDANGLIVSGTHSSLEDLVNDFEGTVEYHHTIGNTNYILPGAPWKTAVELDDTIEKLNRFQPMLAAEGITLGYHNHNGEFLPNEDGLIPHAEMEKRTSVQFEIDTYWAYVAGQDPVELITRLQERVKVIHLKDGLANGEGFALGEGTAPVAAVHERAKELGMRMVVESETLKPDGLLEVTRCMEYLKKL